MGKISTISYVLSDMENMHLPEPGLLSCQFYFNSTNYKKPQIVTDLLNIDPSKTFTKKLRT